MWLARRACARIVSWRSFRPPFTLQRLCELVVNPRRFYKTLPKLVSALDKCVTVSSTLELAERGV